MKLLLPLWITEIPTVCAQEKKKNWKKLRIQILINGGGKINIIVHNYELHETDFVLSGIGSKVHAACM